VNATTGPKGEKRPADVIGNAVKVMRVAPGDKNETQPSALDGAGWAPAEKSPALSRDGEIA
jgi:hypothetical protein